jgi:hypothetical protein
LEFGEQRKIPAVAAFPAIHTRLFILRLGCASWANRTAWPLSKCTDRSQIYDAFSSIKAWDAAHKCPPRFQNDQSAA